MTDVAPIGDAETWQAEPADPSPPVVYIAGSGRSGSTILERVLGQMPGFVNVGELIDLSRRSLEGERCGCGLALTACPFWLGVGKRAFGGWDTGCLAEIGRLQSRVARQRHVPRLLGIRMAGRGFQQDVGAYGAYHKKLYGAIAAEAAAQYVVDSSKWPVQALALARSGADIRVIHLVRDARGVAYSLGKKNVARPHALGEPDVMWRATPAGAAARWVACQGQAELLHSCGVRITRVRYEDFIREPRRTVEVALARLGLPHDPSQLAHVGDKKVTLGKSHGLSGNPSRFRDGETVLNNDGDWRRQMPGRDRAIVTAISLPFLLGYARHTGTGHTGTGHTGTGHTGTGQAGTRHTDTQPAGARQAGTGHTRTGHRGTRQTGARQAGTRHTGTRQMGAGQAAATTAAPAAGPARWPDVSVIITTRGRPELVRETIAAVAAQAYPGDIECIVVHDQEPPDEGLVRLSTPRCRVRVMANTRAPGLAGARNTGLGAAGADYIATCDDDDVWHPDKLEAQITRLLSEPDLLAIGSGLRLLLPGGRTLDWPGRAERVSYQLLLRNRVKELHSSTLVMRREAFTKAGRYDEEIPFGYPEDYDWLLRVAKVGGLGLVQRPLADIRRDGASVFQGSGEKVSAGLEYLLAKHPDFTTSRRGHARLLGQIAYARSSLGQRGRALRLTAKSLALWPASPYPYIALVHIVTGTEPRHLMRAARLFRREVA